MDERGRFGQSVKMSTMDGRGIPGSMGEKVRFMSYILFVLQ